MATIIEATSASRIRSHHENCQGHCHEGHHSSCHDITSDPLVAALTTYIATPPGPVPGNTGPMQIVLNRTLDVAQFPKNKILLELANGLQAWLADPDSHSAISSAIRRNSSVAEIEQMLKGNSNALCQRITKYSEKVVSSRTRRYCCNRNGC